MVRRTDTGWRICLPRWGLMDHVGGCRVGLAAAEFRSGGQSLNGVDRDMALFGNLKHGDCSILRP